MRVVSRVCVLGRAHVGRGGVWARRRGLRGALTQCLGPCRRSSWRGTCCRGSGRPGPTALPRSGRASTSSTETRLRGGGRAQRAAFGRRKRGAYAGGGARGSAPLVFRLRRTVLNARRMADQGVVAGGWNIICTLFPVGWRYFFWVYFIANLAEPRNLREPTHRGWRSRPEARGIAGWRWGQ